MHTTGIVLLETEYQPWLVQLQAHIQEAETECSSGVSLLACIPVLSVKHSVFSV